jgi:subtilisin family serine protease
MKIKILLLFLFLGFSVPVFAQSSRLSLPLLSRLEGVKAGRLNGDNEVSVLIRGDVEKIKEEISSRGGVFKYAAGDIASVRIPLAELESFSREGFVERIEGNEQKMELFNDTMVYNNDLLPVFLGMSPLTQAYDGSGVVVGIIDNEIDFNHPDFKDANGKTRIKYIWDHTVNPLIKPLPYNYGVEWTSADIDNGIAVVASNNSTIGHGTHVAGIAAGNGLALNNYKGAAPRADLIVVVLDFSKPDSLWLQEIADATDYIYAKAKLMGKPCVINASVGTYDGSHDGRDLQGQAINNLVTAQKGRAFVCAAGNRGNINTHLGYDVKPDSSFTWFNYNASFGNINMVIYADTADLRNVQFAFGADMVSPSYKYRGRTPYNKIFKFLNTTYQDSLYKNGKRIGRIKSRGQLIGNRYSLTVTITPDSTAYYWRLITKGSGRIDLWHNGIIFSGLPTALQFPDIARYQAPDNTQTIASSFTCAPNVITVGSYVNRNHFTNVNGGSTSDASLSPGSRAFDSSIGPSRDGRLKPEITAPGTWVLSCANYNDLPGAIAFSPASVAAGGLHRRYSGTSMASPSVAGMIALYLQKNPNADFQQIKNALTLCAKKDQQTGTTLPNNVWGYGKADAFRMLAGCSSGISEDGMLTYGFKVFPNPFYGEAQIAYEPGVKMTQSIVMNSEFQLTDLSGRILRVLPLKGEGGLLSLNMYGMRSGMYFCRLVVEGRVYNTEKLILINTEGN